MKKITLVFISILIIGLGNNSLAQGNDKPSLCSDDLLAKINMMKTVDPMAYTSPLDNKDTESLKMKRMKIAGYSILSGMVGGGTILGIWGGVKAKKAGEKFGEQYFRDKRYSNHLFTGIMSTTLGLSASIPLILKSRKAKEKGE